MPTLGLYSSGWGTHDRVAFGASDFWRLAVPGRELARNGWTVIPGREVFAKPSSGELMLKDEHGGLHDGLDVVFWQRWMGVGAADAIRRARSLGQVVVNDLDDMYWALPSSNTARQFTDPRRNKSYNRDVYKDVLKASSLITVSTPFLANVVARWGPEVRVVKNYVPLDKWPPLPPGDHYGWVGAVPWRGADLQLLTRTVIPWLRERGEPFYHGGHMNDAPSAGSILKYEKMEVTEAVDLQRYPRLWRPLRVALIPIENSTFGNAKSWVKGLEACARGIPFIASNHREYQELGAGRLVERPRDWARHLDELLDPSVYAAECAASRERAESLSIENNWHAWDDVLHEALLTAGGSFRNASLVSPIGSVS